jgi:hypothetical protein
MSVLSRIIRLCKKAEAWLVQCQTREQEVANTHYDTLAPKTINDESMQEYFTALKYALSQKDVRNIAITGNYGAGKSTVVSSFMKYHCDEKYINVSLAGFDMTENKDTVAPPHQEVELSILQQILYKENRDSLPDSRIDRILNRNPGHTLKTYGSFLKVAIPTAGFIGLLYFKTVTDFIGLPSTWSAFLNEHFIIKSAGLALTALAALYFITECASRIGIFDKKIKLSKIAFLSGDVEVSEKESSSLLNNCLDEIVYFFSRLEYKVVVFEDLDRLGTPEIFVKLREINKIINNNIAHDKPVRFIYAVRDDLFLGADSRTKFFDFIIPVIPFMDNRNAFTLLKNKLPEFDKKSDPHLKKISSYIGDMRSLQNIINEYLIFSEVVDNTKVQIRLFSLVFYKNIYALDYYLADKKTGILYSFIHNYRTQKLHTSHFSALDDELSELQAEAKKLKEETLLYPEEIRLDIISRFIPKILWGKVFFAIKINNNEYSPFDSSQLVSDEQYFIANFSTHECLYVGYHFYNYNQIQNMYTPMGTDVIDNLLEEYLERKKILGEDKNKSFRKLHQKLHDVNSTIRSRNAIPLNELIHSIGRENFDGIAKQYLEEMKDHDFITAQQHSVLRTDMHYGGLDALYVLLSDGLVMQDYMSYRSIFHEGAMSVNDNDFVKAVGQDLNCETSNSEYYIDDEAMVINELVEQNRIYAHGAWHHQLMTHLIDTRNEYFTGMIASIFRQSDEAIFTVFSVLYTRFSKPDTFDKLIVNALDLNDYLDRMIVVLRINREMLFINDISISVIAGLSPVKALDKSEYRSFIHLLGSRIISQLPHDKCEYFMKHILQAGTCYEELFRPFTPTELYCLQFIANHSLYRITKNNVGIVISCLLENDNLSPEEAQKKPWTLSTEHHFTTLREYFIANINEFVFNVFVSSNEDAECIRDILTDTPLNSKSKEMILREMNFSLPDLSGIPVTPSFNKDNEILSFHDLFYHYDRVTPGWESLLDYICEDCNLNILSAYATKHASEFSKSCPEVYDGDRYDLLYMKIICNEILNEYTYQQLVLPIQINMHEIDNKLSARNFCRLITLLKLSLSDETYERIAVQYCVLDEELCDAFVCWFSQYHDVFLGNPEFYLRKTADTYFFKTLLSRIMHDSCFTVVERASLVSLFIDYYSDLDTTELNLPHDVILTVINTSENKLFKIRLFVKLISMGYRHKSDLAELCHQIDENELQNVFIKRTQATITVTEKEHVILILEKLQSVHMIKSFQAREDGKITVIINPGTEEEE